MDKFKKSVKAEFVEIPFLFYSSHNFSSYIYEQSLGATLYFRVLVAPLGAIFRIFFIGNWHLFTIINTDKIIFKSILFYTNERNE